MPRPITIYDEDTAISQSIKALESGRIRKIKGFPKGAVIKDFELYEGEVDEWSDSGIWIKGVVWGELIYTLRGRSYSATLFVYINRGKATGASLK